MIDTITIKVPMAYLHRAQTKEEQLAFLQTWDKNDNHTFPTWKRNPTPAELATGYYFPFLTAHKEQTLNWMVAIKIQFSVPKLLFGNNLDEVTSQDTNNVVQTLKARLITMGLQPQAPALLTAHVASVHYSKNIIIRNYGASAVVYQLNRIALTGRNQKRDVNYSNNGISLNIYNKSHSFTIYDKTAEMYSRDSNLNPEAVSLPEVLRLEVRLENHKKINQVFTRLNIHPDPTLKDALDTEISRQVITHYWQQHVHPQLAVVSGATESPLDLFQRILAHHPDVTLSRAMKLTALVLCSRSPGGMGVLRSILRRHQDIRSWQRMYREIKEVNETLAVVEHPWREEIESQLATYEPMRLITN
jgi:hypothetical protein